MDYQRCASSAKNRVGVISKCHVGSNQARLGFTFGVNRKVRNITGVWALGVFEAVMLSVRIKVGAGRFEVRSLAFANLMNVDSVFPGRKSLQVQLDFDSLGSWR